MPADQQPIPILLDTDIGDNVDDALALSLACQSPELHLVGVTTVSGDTRDRAMLALLLLGTLGRRDVPVAAGAGAPLAGTSNRTAPWYTDALAADFADALDRRDAVQMMLDIARNADQRTTICCVGPVTNLAIVLKQLPGFAERVRIVLMGGMTGASAPVFDEQRLVDGRSESRRCETNISADAESARVVFASGADITMVGLDVTLQCELAPGDMAQIRRCEFPHTQLLARMIDAWMVHSRRPPTLHDPLAVAMCFDPSLCARRPMQIQIEESSGMQGSVTIAHPLPESRTRVCTSVNRERFFDMFLSRICAPARGAVPKGGFTLIELLIVVAIIALLAMILLPAVQTTRARAQHAECTNNLFQIGLALSNYHDAHRTYPPGYVSAAGPAGEDIGPGWSWAAMLLPMLEESRIYARIRFDENVDSTDNAELWGQQRIDIFMCPSDLSASSYVACYGQGDMAQAPDRGEGVFFRNSRIRQRDIEDGPMTILVGERSSVMGGAEWAGVHPMSLADVISRRMLASLSDRTRVLGHTGSPVGIELVHTPNQPAVCGAGFGSAHPGGANFLMADGSVRFIKSDIDANIYAGLASRSGGEPVSANDF